jgi:hypothetical protein
MSSKKILKALHAQVIGPKMDKRTTHIKIQKHRLACIQKTNHQRIYNSY